jgi:hypothetical protein
MTFAVAIVIGVAFGAADQYLGSLRSLVSLGPWAVAVSGMSAPWLLLPFVFGCTQDRPRRAMLVGLVATTSALAGYFAMTVSPMEGVALRDASHAGAALLRSNGLVIAGGLVTAPAFGFLGQRWRAERWWVSAAVVAGAFLLEPLALLSTGRLSGPGWIWLTEMAVGACLALGFLVAGSLSRRNSAPLLRD